MSAALAVMDAEIASAESLAVSDAYQAERLPKLREARAAVAELVGAAEKAYGHLACIGHPVDKHGRYHKDGEWTFSEAMPNPADASEAKAAFLTLRAALARCGGAK